MKPVVPGNSHNKPTKNKTSLPALSAIVVVPDRYETVQTTMGYLKKQTIVEQIELVFVVTKTNQFNPVDSDLQPFHSWKTVQVDEITSIGQSFTAGILQAGAPLVALTEDHSYPDPGWAELFVNAHRQPWAVVGPSMRNGNPVNLVSWADYYQAYGQWTHPVQSGPMLSVPGHNSCYKRDILLSFGDSIWVLMQAESVLHRHLLERGYKVVLESGTCTSHLNFFTWSTWIPARYYAGRQFAGTWAHSWSWPRRAAYAVASPGIPWLRLWRTWKFVFRHHNALLSLRILCIILFGFSVEASGNLIGFLAGSGDASRKMAAYEFHRIKSN